MASIPDISGPGDNPNLPALEQSDAIEQPTAPQVVSPDAQPQNYLQSVAAAYNAGYSYQDLVAHHDANDLGTPPRPDLDTVMNRDSSQPLTEQDFKSAVNAPVGDLVNAVAGAGVGSIEAVGAEVASAVAPAVKSMATDLTGWIHGSDTNITTDMLQKGRTMWLTQNPAVAKNVGSNLHDVELRPGTVQDVTDQLGDLTGTAAQNKVRDIAEQVNYDNPEGIRYIDADIPGTGKVRVVVNQSSVYNINRRR